MELGILFEIAVLLYGLVQLIIMYLIFNFDFARDIKTAGSITKEFSSRQTYAAMFFDISIALYYSLRIYQWSLGYHGYGFIFVDILVVIISAVLFFLTYPSMIDKLNRIEMVYKDELKDFKE